MNHVLLLPFGTSGSVFPFIWLGRVLRNRGHQVTMIAAPMYEKSAVSAGIDFFSPDTDELSLMLADPGLWQQSSCTKVAFKYGGRAVGPCMTAIDRLILEVGKPDLILAPMISFGARIAREKYGICLITVHLYPAAMMSADDMPLAIPSLWFLGLLPLPARKFILSLPSPYDRFALPEVRRVCVDHGVAPPRRLWKDWHHSPDGVLALFPSWFSSVKHDQPDNTCQWDFPLEDMGQHRGMDPDLENFLTSGEKPILFTAGTGQFHAAEFFQIATRVVSKLGCRAIFLTIKADQVPNNLPDSIFVAASAPFGELLPRAAMMVHHGGIGTLSQCLAAGIPQLVVFMALDQPDNATRIEKLGVGRCINRRNLTEGRLLSQIKRCLNDEKILASATLHAKRMKDRQPLTAMLSWLEQTMAKATGISQSSTFRPLE